MGLNHYVLAFSLAATAASAQTRFPLGNGMEKWGLPLQVPQSEVTLRLGARYQGLATMLKEENLDTGSESTSQDFQSRRIRFQLEATLPQGILFNMDVRNDGANEGDDGDGSFVVGDAYVQVPGSEGDLAYAVRLYRAKVDVSRTETASSSELLFVNRPYVADEAANFVSDGRRATNAQIVGNFRKKISFQIAAGDGVHSRDFKDAKGEGVEEIQKQNFMVGGKLRFHPIEGWEDLKPSETYFGEGRHFSVGVGAFNTSNIRFIEAGKEGKVSRTLYNVEASAHYGEWFLESEYFNMDGVIEDHSAAEFNKGRSEGWYVQGEKVFANFHFLAPFARYELWDRFIGSGDHKQESFMYGLNWYLNGNRFRVGLAYERINQGRDIAGSRERSEAFHLASMWHF